MIELGGFERAARAESRISTSAPPERVFAILTDPVCLPRWQYWVAGAWGVPAGRLKTGSGLHTVNRRLPPSWELHALVVEAREPDELRLEGRTGSLRFHAAFHLMPAAEGTRISFAVRLLPDRILAMVGPLLTVLLRRQLRTWLRNLVAVAEDDA